MNLLLLVLLLLLLLAGAAARHVESRPLFDSLVRAARCAGIFRVRTCTYEVGRRERERAKERKLEDGAAMGLPRVILRSITVSRSWDRGQDAVAVAVAVTVTVALARGVQGREVVW